MRVTVDDFIDNQDVQRKFNGVRVMVNGIQHDYVIIADQERGYIEKYRKNEDGSLVLNADRSEVLTEIIKGDVQFVFKELDL